MKPVQSESNYKYYAFISYKRQDSKWADWLYRNLQSYRLPSKICKKNKDLSKRLCPVFLDKEDLSPGALGESLKEHISESKFFISVCSKNTQNNPQYIDMELQYFLETHGNDYSKVIPFIVDESERPEEECFSPEMQRLCLENNLIGVNVNERGKHRAFLKVVAYMHGIKAAEIESADDIRRRRNILSASLAGMLVILACVLGVVYWWNHFALHTDYYVGYVFENNVAKGVGEIEKAELDDYARYYVIESRDGRVLSVTYKNYAGTIIPIGAHETVLNMGASRIEFTYTGEKEKHLYTAKYLNHNSLPIVCYQYSADGSHVTLLQNEESGIPAYVTPGIGIEEAEHKTKLYDNITYISKYIQKYDKNGRLVTRYYAHGDDYAKVPDGNGVFGFDLGYDKNGNLASISYFADEGGGKLGESDGISSVEYIHDENARMLSVSYRDSEGKPVNCADGWASTDYEWHKNNYLCKTSYKNALGEPVLVNGYAVIKREYEDFGTCREYYYGKNGEAVLCSDGYASVLYRSNEKGQVCLCEYFGIEGEPVKNITDGVYGYRMDWISEDEYCIIYTNERGEPMLCLEGYAYVYIKTNEFELPLRQEYRDADNRRCTERYAICTYEYEDIYNKAINIKYFDHNGDPVIYPEIGCAELVQAFDDRGYQTLCEFRGTDGELCNGNDGYAKIISSCTLKGTDTVTTTMYYDAEGNPFFNRIVNAYGHTYTFDEMGRMESVTYLDGEKEPYFNEANHCARVLYEYYEDGNLKRMSHYGANLENVAVEGVWAVKYSYDENGNTLSRDYYDITGKITDSTVYRENGIKQFDKSYDENGSLKLCIFYDENGKMQHSELYDENGTKRYAVFYAEDGSRLYSEQYEEDGTFEYLDRYGKDGKKESREYYNEDGTLSYLFMFGEDGQLVSCEFLGEDGNVVSREYYDENELPVYRDYYDESGNIISCLMYDENGKKICREYYGEDGSIVSRIIYDESEKPLCCEHYSADGALVFIDYYDENGNVFASEYYDSEGYPNYCIIFNEDGSRHCSEFYDKNGNVTSCIFYDENGNQSYRDFYDADGNITCRIHCDEWGNDVKWDYFRADGSLQFCEFYSADGIAESTAYYNESGMLFAWEYYDTDGTVLYTDLYDADGNIFACEYYDKNGVMVCTEYYSGGAVIGIEFYDENGNLAVNPEYGYAGVGYTYDEKGQITEIYYYYELDGSLVYMINEVEGYSSVRYRYDDNGNICEIYYYDDYGSHMNHLYEGYAAAVITYDESGEIYSISLFKYEDGSFVPMQ